jgi:hypothetical protein
VTHIPQVLVASYFALRVLLIVPGDRCEVLMRYMQACNVGRAEQVMHILVVCVIERSNYSFGYRFEFSVVLLIHVTDVV